MFWLKINFFARTLDKRPENVKKLPIKKKSALHVDVFVIGRSAWCKNRVYQ